MERPVELRFKIDGSFSPETIPMLRLAEYMEHLATLLGETTKVHFVGLEEGSTVIVHSVEQEAIPRVEERAANLRRGEALPEVMAAYRSINRKLRDDNAKALLSGDKMGEIIAFPGREKREPVTFGAFNQEGSLSGVVIRLGGTQEVVPVSLEAGETIYHCYAQRSIAKKLGEHIFTSELRVIGTGRWHRDEEGRWVLDRFTISDFEVLDDAPLSAVVSALRDVKGSEWEKLDDPWGVLRGIRSGPDGDQ